MKTETPLIAEDRERGLRSELTTSTPLLRYGIPALRITVNGATTDYAPSDMLPDGAWPGAQLASDYVAQCAEMFGSSELERKFIEAGGTH